LSELFDLFIMRTMEYRQEEVFLQKSPVPVFAC